MLHNNTKLLFSTWTFPYASKMVREMENEMESQVVDVQQPQHVKQKDPSLNYIRAVQIGILLVIIGIIITIGVEGFADSGSGGIYDFYPSYPDWVNQAVTMGGIVYYIGLCTLLLGLFSLAIKAKELHIYLRVGLIVAFAIVFAAGMNSLITFSLNSLF